MSNQSLLTHSSDQLNVGSVIRIRNFTNISNDPDSRLQVSFSAPKNNVFIAVLLGIEQKFAKPDQEVQLEDALRSLGWVRASEMEALAAEYSKISQPVGRKGTEEHSLSEDVRRALEEK
jgi:hypothetical protein